MNRLILMTILVCAVGCGSDESAGGGGVGASGGTGGEAGTTTSPLCRDACAVTLSCDPAADTAACETQCEKEVAGQGHLIPEIAKDYFGQFAALSDDKDCLYSKGGNAWRKWSDDPTNFSKLAEQSVLEDCRIKYSVCRDPGGSVDGNRGACFFGFYRHNVALREKLWPCLDLACSFKEPQKCINDLQPTGEPWLAGVEQPNLQ